MDPRALYDDPTTDLFAHDGVEPSTMMGFPCVRIDGAFFASWDPGARRLIVKLPADRVADLIDDGTGLAFAPNGRRFREWVAIPRPDEATWRMLLEEAMEFAGGKA